MLNGEVWMLFAEVEETGDNQVQALAIDIEDVLSIACKDWEVFCKCASSIEFTWNCLFDTVPKTC